MGRCRFKKVLTGHFVKLASQSAHFCFEQGLVKKEKIRPVATHIIKPAKPLNRHPKMLRQHPGSLIAKTGVGINRGQVITSSGIARPFRRETPPSEGGRTLFYSTTVFFI